MKKILIIGCALLLLSLTACSNENSDKKQEQKEYKQANGKKVSIPKKPKRIAVLTPFYVGDFIELGVKPVAVLDWTKDSSILKSRLKGTPSVGENDVEKVAEQKPDLIISDSRDKNNKKYQKIASTVSFSPTDYNYKEILIEIGKITNEKEKANQWVKNWEQQTKKDRKLIQAKTKGQTATIFEPDTKNINIFGTNWGGRGLEIVHGAFGMPMEKSYKEKLKENGKGYHSVSKEEINNLSGDYIFLSEPKNTNFDFKRTDTWKNIDAVKNGKVFSYRAEDYWFTDPITLEHLRTKLKQDILSK
ncbi:ABC transporter substrate-binding protein [Staphylococcus sp. KG4-3]|uniref:Ferrichrome ABC transporter substrate-binding protein n=1 Tax=Staphylococcus xylosus TaxID=1288 RepID=A0A418IKU6_STAXY|nr:MULTISPECIES: ABC transporter substrate-binding protein [Staphylococcus]MDW8543623.1 ABC transporter substrate-binding protein [Staphylococcus sp. KG4-1]MDW8563054.1 ABC transporter substrate-binding protein [Staphylococcus sp. KG4-3]RIN08223.1 ferrichrome ABC transporter substrate-binding protein [Staphylococcus xylosus]